MGETDSEGFTYLPIMIQCGPSEKMLEVLKDYEEQPFLTGNISFTIPSGQVMSQPGAVYLNPKTGSMSVVVAFAESNAICHILNGMALGPAVQQSNVKYYLYTHINSCMIDTTPFERLISDLKESGKYRVFNDILRERGEYPNAIWYGKYAIKNIVNWCSNDYLGMGQHKVVLDAMHTALDQTGAGSGGTRNIAGTSHYHVACLLYTSDAADE